MKKYFKRPYLIVIIFTILVGIGIFLRTYNFHDWLLIEVDQIRDAILVEDVVTGKNAWPSLGATMRASGDTQDALFRVGPVYYYFQIISSKMFGVNPVSMAYPDLFFSILSIPLFYFFLKRYFNNDTALFLMGLYSISFFIIKYSRFAWNPNSIPFFVILFLSSMHEFILKKENTSWWWIFAGGISLGVGVQLHATMLLLLSAISIIVAMYLLKKNSQTWKKIVVVVLLALLVNTPQILSEVRTNFANSRALFNSPVKEGRTDKKSKILIISETLSCNIEANAYLLTSIGDVNCNYDYVKMLQNNKSGKAFRSELPWLELSVVLLFSLLGYLLLSYCFKLESDKSKKNFLGLIIVFALIFFLIMLPVIGSEFKEFRYFGPVFFVPYLLLGLIINFLIEKKKNIYTASVVLMIVFIVSANISSIYNMTVRLDRHEGNNGHAVYLGEVEDVFGYIKDRDAVKTSGRIYLMSEKIYSGNIFIPGSYVANKYGYKVVRTPSPENVPEGVPLFFIASNEGEYETMKDGRKVEDVKNFGLIRLYELEN